MTSSVDLTEEELQVKRFKIQYPASAYTFPRDAIISTVRFDDEFVHVESHRWADYLRAAVVDSNTLQRDVRGT